MEWILLVGGSLGAWAVLSIVSAERQRRMSELAARQRVEADAAAARAAAEAALTADAAASPAAPKS